jgi:transmembrane sensor
MIKKEPNMQNEDRRDSAISWHIRLSNPAAPAEDWEAFQIWLDANSANADTYDLIAMDDAALSDVIASQSAAYNDNEVAAWAPTRRWAVFVAAATVIGGLLATSWIMSAGNIETIQTRAGEVREIALKDGSSITLNGDTRIKLERDDERQMTLENGEALLVIKHDASRPFIVEAGSTTLKDLGTTFNVRRLDDALDVAVAEGAVAYNPAVDAITIGAGNRLQIARGDGKPKLSKIDPASVTGWRYGRLSYHNALLGEIAADVSRALGTPILVAPELASRRFSGLIRVEPDQELFFRRLESLLGIHARRYRAGWQLTA